MVQQAVQAVPTPMLPASRVATLLASKEMHLTRHICTLRVATTVLELATTESSPVALKIPEEYLHTRSKRLQKSLPSFQAPVVEKEPAVVISQCV